MSEFWRRHLEREYKRHHQTMNSNGNNRKNYLLFWSHKWPTEVERVARGHIYENFGTSGSNLSFSVSEIQLFENDLRAQIRFQPQILMNPYYCVCPEMRHIFHGRPPLQNFLFWYSSPCLQIKVLFSLTRPKLLSGYTFHTWEHICAFLLWPWEFLDISG